MSIKLLAGKVLLVGGLVSTRCCGEPCSVSITCASLTAEPSLVGWSAYVNPNDGPFYKWRSRTLSGTFDERMLVGSPSTECDRAQQRVYSGTAEIDETGIVAYANLHLVSFNELGPVPCEIDSETDTNVTDLGFAYHDPCTGVNELSDSFTATVRTVTRCTGGPSTGSGTETLGDPDTVAAAIARATPTVGTSCCAVTGVIGTTSAGNTDPLSLGESTSVMLTISLTGQPSTSYDIELVFKNYIDSDDTALADTTEALTITTDVDGVAEVEYDIPQPGSDRRRCFDSWHYVAP